MSDDDFKPLADLNDLIHRLHRARAITECAHDALNSREPQTSLALEVVLDLLVDAIDATAEQEKQIWAIIDGVRGDVRPMMRDFRDAREQVVALLSAPTVDAAAVEKLRAERIAAIDEASKKMSAAIVQAAGVLTPEQRAKLAVRFEEGGRW